MSILPETTVGTVAVEHPLATRVFARHGIDFCCGGGRPLAEVCAERGLDVERVLTEIESEISSSPSGHVQWDDEPVDALIEHILRVYHGPHKEELPRLEAMARKVHQVHGPKDPDRLRGVLDTVVALRADVEEHLVKEEQVLFPMIRHGQGGNATEPIAQMEREHETVGGLLRTLRELTDEYRVPEGACNTWRALWVGLLDFERALHEHIHLENNILHKRALAV